MVFKVDIESATRFSTVRRIAEKLAHLPIPLREAVAGAWGDRWEVCCANGGRYEDCIVQDWALRMNV